MAKSRSAASGLEIVLSDLWQSPLAWGGTPLRAIENYSRPLPAGTIFVRAEFVFTVSKEIQPGMTSQIERALPGLIRLDQGKPVEAHVQGLDDRCWTYQLSRKGKKIRWELFADSSHPANKALTSEEVTRLGIERAILQSVLPIGSQSGYISLMLNDDYSVEDFSKAVEEDA